MSVHCKSGEMLFGEWLLVNFPVAQSNSQAVIEKNSQAVVWPKKLVIYYERIGHTATYSKKRKN